MERKICTLCNREQKMKIFAAIIHNVKILIVIEV